MFLKLGIVGRALGLQGSFYVSGRDEPIPETVKTIKIGQRLEIARDAEIISVGWQKGRATIKCNIAHDRTAAELLTGMSIWTSDAQVKVENENEFLLSDLIGRTVFDSDGVKLGVVEDVVRMPASTNMVVVNGDLSADVDIPVISDYVDMRFKRWDTAINLVVPLSTFEEIWNSRKKK